MSTICIPLMFSQKAQELKPYDMLNNQSENFQQLHFQLLSTAADMQQSLSSLCKALMIPQLQFFPSSHTPRREKSQGKVQTGHKLLKTNPQLQILRPKQHLVPSS